MDDSPGQVSALPSHSTEYAARTMGSVSSRRKSDDGRCHVHDEAGTRRPRFKLPTTRATVQGSRVCLPAAYFKPRLEFFSFRVDFLFSYFIFLPLSLLPLLFGS